MEKDTTKKINIEIKKYHKRRIQLRRRIVII